MERVPPAAHMHAVPQLQRPELFTPSSLSLSTRTYWGAAGGPSRGRVPATPVSSTPAHVAHDSGPGGTDRGMERVPPAAHTHMPYYSYNDQSHQHDHHFHYQYVHNGAPPEACPAAVYPPPPFPARQLTPRRARQRPGRDRSGYGTRPPGRTHACRTTTTTITLAINTYILGLRRRPALWLFTSRPRFQHASSRRARQRPGRDRPGYGTRPSGRTHTCRTTTTVIRAIYTIIIPTINTYVLGSRRRPSMWPFTRRPRFEQNGLHTPDHTQACRTTTVPANTCAQHGQHDSTTPARHAQRGAR